MRPDRHHRPRLEPEAHLGDDLAGREARVPVGELELIGCEAAGTDRVDHERIDHHGAPVGAVGAGVHPHPAADRPRDRRRELETAEPGVAGPMKTDGIRRPAAGDEHIALDLNLGQLAFEPEHERVDAVVVDEHVRAEPDHLDGDLLAPRPAEQLLQLGQARRAREEPRRPAGADRREPRERDVLLELHLAKRSRSSAGARSTSPAPITSTTSPG